MPDVAAVLREEIARLARKEVKQQIGPLKKTMAEQRRTIAELRRQVRALAGDQAFLQQQEKRRLTEAPEPSAAAGVRFAPRSVQTDRRRVGLSARDYCLLVGVSGQTIYSWETGKSKPRATALAGWAAVRGMGRREALRRLELVEG